MYREILREYAASNDISLSFYWISEEVDGPTHIRKLGVTVRKHRYVSPPLHPYHTLEDDEEAVALVAVEDLLRQGSLQLQGREAKAVLEDIASRRDKILSYEFQVSVTADGAGAHYIGRAMTKEEAEDMAVSQAIRGIL